MSAHTERVQDYYAHTRLDYWLLWTRKSNLAVHFGYYDERVKNHAESLLRINEVLADAVHISSKDIVLDAGCGYGGSAIWLAKNRKCKVAGLTIVPEQVKKGAKFAKHWGVSNSVSLMYGDYAQTSFQQQSFDVVWALESFVHAEDKYKACQEAFRVLKTDGRLVIAEYLLREQPPLSVQEESVVKPWMNGWAMPSLLTPHQYQVYLENIGFSNVQLKDITKFINPSLKRLEIMALLALPVAKGLRQLNAFNETRYGNVKASYYQNKALREGLWNYWMITAKKSL